MNNGTTIHSMRNPYTGKKYIHLDEFKQYLMRTALNLDDKMELGLIKELIGVLDNMGE